MLKKKCKANIEGCHCLIASKKNRNIKKFTVLAESIKKSEMNEIEELDDRLHHGHLINSIIDKINELTLELNRINKEAYELEKSKN